MNQPILVGPHVQGESPQNCRYGCRPPPPLAHPFASSTGTKRRVRQDSGGMNRRMEYTLTQPPTCPKKVGLPHLIPQPRRFPMVRLVWALGLVLFLAACGGGSGGGGSGIPASLLGTQEISSRAQELVNANPIFIGSDVVLIYDGDDGERAIERDSSARCGMDECVIDDQETSLAALLFAEGFNPTERRRGVDLGRGSLQHLKARYSDMAAGWKTAPLPSTQAS